jgi:preprotein translocase subunit SecG
MITFLQVLHVLVSIVLIGIILIQAGKGQGLAGAFGSFAGGTAQNLFGARTSDVLTKVTAYLATFFLVSSLLLAYLQVRESSSVMEDLPRRETPAESGKQSARQIEEKVDELTRKLLDSKKKIEETTGKDAEQTAPESTEPPPQEQSAAPTLDTEPASPTLDETRPDSPAAPEEPAPAESVPEAPDTMVPEPSMNVDSPGPSPDILPRDDARQEPMEAPDVPPVDRPPLKDIEETVPGPTPPEASGMPETEKVASPASVAPAEEEALSEEEIEAVEPVTPPPRMPSIAVSENVPPASLPEQADIQSPVAAPETEEISADDTQPVDAAPGETPAESAKVPTETVPDEAPAPAESAAEETPMDSGDETAADTMTESGPEQPGEAPVKTEQPMDADETVPDEAPAPAESAAEETPMDSGDETAADTMTESGPEQPGEAPVETE